LNNQDGQKTLAVIILY